MVEAQQRQRRRQQQRQRQRQRLRQRQHRKQILPVINFACKSAKDSEMETEPARQTI